MGPTPLLLLILPALCLAHSVHRRSPPPACPERICVCTVGEGQQREANCTELPAERLANTITTLRVSGPVAKVTKEMIVALGGDLLHLDLSGCAIRTVGAGSFDGAPKLLSLSLSDNRVEEIGPGTFGKRSDAMRELRLDGNRLKRVDEAAFSRLGHLRELRLERNYLSRLPAKMPASLTVLNVSHNNLGPDLGGEMHDTNLKELNLCGNRLERLTNTTLHALNKLQKLCVGDLAVHFPKNAAAYLPHLSDLSLVASAGSPAQLDAATEQELAGMGTLTSLAIVNYRLESLSFLHSLAKLRHLTLRGVATHGPVVDFQSILLSKTSLVDLDLEGSGALARSLLDKMRVLAALGGLRSVGLRDTGLTHLSSEDVPRGNEGFRLDLSGNPLRCDCGLVWLGGGQLESLLINAEETRCAAPIGRVGQRLADVVGGLKCSSGAYRDVRDYPSAGPNHERDPQPNRGTWNRPPVRFPSHQSPGGGSEYPSQGGGSEYPSQGGGSKYPSQGGESEYPSQGGGSKYPSQGNESEFPSQPDQGGEGEFPADNENGGEIEVVSIGPDKTEVTGQAGDPDDSPVTTYEGEGLTSTSYPGDGTHEHMQSHGADTDYGIVYIVLGSLLGLLTVVGLILGAIYWWFRRTGGNKVAPGTGVAGAPVEPTFKQLQQTEDSSLLKGVKK